MRLYGLELPDRASATMDGESGAERALRMAAVLAILLAAPTPAEAARGATRLADGAEPGRPARAWRPTSATRTPPTSSSSRRSATCRSIPAASSAYTYRWNAERGALERVDDMVSPCSSPSAARRSARACSTSASPSATTDVDVLRRVRSSASIPFPLSVQRRRHPVPGADRPRLHRRHLQPHLRGDRRPRREHRDPDRHARHGPRRHARRTRRAARACGAPRAQESAANLSDMLVRAKYRLFETTWALGRPSAPAGCASASRRATRRAGSARATARSGPYFALSTSLLDGWLDSHWDAGRRRRHRRHAAQLGALLLGARHPRAARRRVVDAAWRSRGACSAGASSPSLRAADVDLGPRTSRRPASRRPSRTSCADANRHDYVDTTLGVRVHLVESIVLSLGVFKALNDQGVRPADWSPVASVEGTF